MLGKLLLVATTDLPAWSARTGFGASDLLECGEWLIVVREDAPYDLYGRTIHNVTFVCHLGVRSCYVNHILENCVEYLIA